MAEPDPIARQYFVEGGGKPELFFAVYGPVPAEWNISGSRYRTRGIPDGISVHVYGPGSNPEVVANNRAGFLWEDFARTEPEAANAALAQDSCVILKGQVEHDDTLGYLQDCVGVIQWLLDQGSVAVFDPYSMCWRTPEIWRDEVFSDAKGPIWPHVVFLSSDEPGGTWLHSRGMIKFGRPDLSLRGVTGDTRDLALEIFRRMAAFQARGGWFADGAKLRMNGAPDGMTCWHRGSMDDPEFNNVHLEIRWPE